MFTTTITYQDSKEWAVRVSDENGKTLSYGAKHKEKNIVDFLDCVKKYSNIQDLANYLSPCCCDETGAYCYQHRSMLKQTAPMTLENCQKKHSNFHDRLNDCSNCPDTKCSFNDNDFSWFDG